MDLINIEISHPNKEALIELQCLKEKERLSYSFFLNQYHQSSFECTEQWLLHFILDAILPKAWCTPSHHTHKIFIAQITLYLGI